MRAAAIGVLTPLVLAVTGGVVVAALWFRDESLRPTTVAAEPIWAPVTEAPEFVAESITFRVERSAIIGVPAPDWAGSVTAAGLVEGAVLDRKLPPPVDVDGLARPWFAAPAPLFRPIHRGDRGADVDVLAGFLVGLGLDPRHEAGTAVDSEMLTAIRNWAAWLGFDRRAIAFEPSWVVWMPDNLVGQRVASVAAELGRPAATEGSDLFAVGGEVISIHVVDSPSATRLSVTGAHDRIVLGSRRFILDLETVDPELLSAVDQLLDDDQDEFTAIVEHVLPPNVDSLPASSLMPTSAGFCVVVSGAADGAESSIRSVVPIGQLSGTALAEIPESHVLLNPAVLGDLTC